MRVNFDGSHNNRPKLGISEQALSAAESNLRFRTLFGDGIISPVRLVLLT
jgi:hypothetical protein